MELAEYYLPSHWVVALINGDESVFEFDDEGYEQFNKFSDQMNKEYASWFAVDCDEESQFMKWHDVQHLGVLAGDCHKVIFHVSEK